MILRCARSPLPPNTTTTHGSGTASTRRPARSGLGTSSCSDEYGNAASRSSALLHRVPAKLVAQRRVYLGAERLLLPRSDALQQRQCDHRRRHVLVDRRLHRPAAFAAVLDISLHLREIGIPGHAIGDELQESGEHHRAVVLAATETGHVDTD